MFSGARSLTGKHPVNNTSEEVFKNGRAGRDGTENRNKRKD